MISTKIIAKKNYVGNYDPSTKYEHSAWFVGPVPAICYNGREANQCHGRHVRYQLPPPKTHFLEILEPSASLHISCTPWRVCMFGSRPCLFRQPVSHYRLVFSNRTPRHCDRSWLVRITVALTPGQRAIFGDFVEQTLSIQSANITMFIARCSLRPSHGSVRVHHVLFGVLCSSSAAHGNSGSPCSVLRLLFTVFCLSCLLHSVH